MSLPKIVTPEYTTQLTSIKTPVRFRPYLVKDEKILLTAKESNDAAAIQDATIQVLKNCTFGQVDIDALPSFDLEYLFLQIRAKSVSEVATPQYECRNIVRTEVERRDETDDGRCHALVPIRIDLREVVVRSNPEHTNLITLGNGIKIEMKYPTSALSRRIAAEPQLMTNTPYIIASCIKTVIDLDGNLLEARDYSEAELIEFVESLSARDAQQFETFFTTAPTLRHEAEFVCPKCQYRETIAFEGLTSFFI